MSAPGYSLPFPTTTDFVRFTTDIGHSDLFCAFSATNFKPNTTDRQIVGRSQSQHAKAAQQL